MKKLEVEINTDVDRKPMPCPNCGARPSSACGYSVKSYCPDFAMYEYDCEFDWESTGIEWPPECDNCPLVWCTKCKDEMVVQAFKQRRGYER